MIDQYFKAFEAKDLASIEQMFAPNVVLQDPFVGRVEGVDSVIAIYQEMFAENEFDLQLRREYQKENQHAIEFRLVITDKKGNKTLIEGIDLIEFHNDKIAFIRAYLDTSVQVQ